MHTSGNILLYTFGLKCVIYVLIGVLIPIASGKLKIDSEKADMVHGNEAISAF